jgi:hypothetical protein
MNRKAYEFSFSWIFAVIVGAFIIFLAVFTAMRLTDVQRTQIDTARGKEISVLLTPVETGIEQTKLVSIIVPNNQETRLFSKCVAPSITNPFGTERISAQVKAGVGKEWQPVPGATSSSHDRYLFLRSNSSAKKEFFVLSKPFLFPFKVGDIIVMWPDSETYCFVETNSVPGLEDELRILNVGSKGVLMASSFADCPSASRKVCFSTSYSDCDVLVQDSAKKVTHYIAGSSFEVSYVDSSDFSNKYPLLLAAIFSEPDEYNCQVARLMSRASNLASLYILKSNYLSATSRCTSAQLLLPSLRDYSTATSLVSSSQDLALLNAKMEDLKAKNEGLSCKLF